MSKISIKKKLAVLVFSSVLITSMFTTGTSNAIGFKLPFIFEVPKFVMPKQSDKINFKWPETKNIIVMISDGCGFNHIDAASYYQYGKTGAQVYEKFPFKCAMSTYSLGSYDSKKAWKNFEYVMSGATDSAAAATAMSTGKKTYDSAIGVDVSGKPLKNIAEKAKEYGKSTGVVTSVELSHATPASFIAHNSNRVNYEDIAKEMIISSKTDVIMGAGNPWFDGNGIKLDEPYSFEYVGGQSVWEGLLNGTLEVADSDGDGKADPWTLIQSKSDFQKLKYGKTPKRVLGVAEVNSSLQHGRSGDYYAEAYEVPLNKNIPSLADMTSGALNVLDNNKRGFFLMVESGAVDRASHNNQSGRMIEEQISFNEAVEAVVKWVERNSSWEKTLLIVTGDHETGYITGPGSNLVWKPVVNNGVGKMPSMQWNSGNHTNSLVPFFAKGADTKFFLEYLDKTDPVRGKYLDNTAIAKAISKIMALSKNIK